LLGGVLPVAALDDLEAGAVQTERALRHQQRAGLLVLLVGAATSQMAATNTLIQNRVPDELRSRVMAVYATMFMGVQPIGSLIAGGVAKHIGAPYTLTVFGSLVLIGSLFFLFRVVLRLGEPQAAAEV